MPWIELHVTTSADLANDLSDQLSEFGAVAVTFQDAGDEPIFEPKPETPRLWHRTIVIGLFDSEHPLDPVIQFLGKNFSFEQKKIEDEDWERRCLDSFTPLNFGKRLWICPSWHIPPDKEAVNIILDPGLAFGTGTHPTTSLCLEWLDANISNQELIIDYGCGSGILAISALKLGAKRAICIDNDSQALESTLENAERNHLNSGQLTTLLPHELPDMEADILLANILAQPLIELAPKFNILTKKWCKIVLSGILCDQVEKVMDAYKPWFEMKEPIYKGEWALLEGIKT
jgi:ribosomal protein L11 methyltransferase